MSFLQSLFANKLNSADNREAVFSIRIRGVDGTFELLGSPLSFWGQLALLLLAQSILCAILGAVVYKFIIQSRGTTFAFLIGYGFVIPFTLWMPFIVIPWLALENMVLMVSIASTPTMVIFRCKEAMYGTSPPVVEKDIGTYCAYYSSVIPFRYDPEKQTAVKATLNDFLSTLRAYLVNLAITVPAFSVMQSCNYSLFPSPRQIGASLTSPLYLFHWGHILNNLAIAGLTSVSLEGGTLGVSLGTILLSGNITEDMMKSPMTLSSSPSDFWSRRWNLAVQGLLKRGVYLPLRANDVSKPLAALATFFTSAVLHEYVLSVIALKGHVLTGDNEPYHPTYGMHFLFFIWNGAVMLMEYFAQNTLAVTRLRMLLPRWAITFLVLLTVIPISHFFTDEYVMSGFYTDYSFGFPVVRYTTNG